MVRPDAVTADDLDFLRRFEECSLPESEWMHLAHVRVAWTCLKLDEPVTALRRIRRGILRYNTEVLGRRHRYHETVTVAFTRIVWSRSRPDEPWHAFETRIDDVLDPGAPILLMYYSRDRLHSDAARESFQAPDIMPLPDFPERCE